MNWQFPIRKALLMGDYPTVAKFYEQLIERKPEIISHYWYLGLAYLLQELVEEAQSIWIFALTQASVEESEQQTALLLKILETEAQRQEKAENVFLAALIRRQLLELDMTVIDNLLHLIRLEINLNTYTPEFLEEWQVIEILKQPNNQRVDPALMLSVLAKILEFPSINSINFAEASLAYINDAESLGATIMQIANRMAYDELKPTYAADLTKICLTVQPDNPYLLNELLSFYSFAKKHDEAIETAQKIYRELERICPTISLKLHSVYRILMTYISMGVWLEIDPLVQRYRYLLLEMAKHPPKTLESFLKGRLLGVVFPLFYLSDNAPENRYIINRIAKLFQDNLELNLPKTKKTSKPSLSHSKLKIGYIAHTLRKHSVGWLSRWLFQYHNRDRFEIFIYLINQPEDEITQNCFRNKSDCTYNFSRDPEKIARQIQEDGINILVDLDSLTHNLTYQVLSLKPAPVQVTWLGFDALGLPTVDYFIADPYVLPENAQDYYQETIWRLPQTYIAIDEFEVGEITLSRRQLDIPNDAIVYFSLQNGFKRHPDTIRLQMKILQAVPNSYMLIKGAANDEIIQQLFQQLALESAVASNRLRFLTQDKDEFTHRANLQIADVVLDTYPYNGATTTLEVLWMEIPLVTRVGEQFAARNSYAFLTNVGVTEGIAMTDEEYIEWGIQLGQNADLRQQVKQKLKASKHKSPLWKAREFTQEMENAYEKMWEKLIVDS